MNPSNPSRRAKILALATAIAVTAAACGSAATIAAPETSSSSPSTMETTQGNTSDETPTAAPANEASIDSDAASDEEDLWYRDVRMSRWTNSGASEASITATVERIRNAEGDRSDPTLFDTIIDYGPGHWTYEFTNSAEDSAQNGNHLEASVLYLAASYPHNNPDGEGGAALQRSIEEYEMAVTEDGFTIERIPLTVEGVDVTALLHLPASADVEPTPVFMVTGGIDVVLTEHYPYFRDYLADSGIAMVSFDIPGTGASSGLILDADMEKVHVAVLDAIASDSRLDSDRVAAMSMSGGGPAVVKLAIEHRDRIVAAVNRCGAVDSALGLPAEVYTAFPAMTVDTYGVRAGLEIGDYEGLSRVTGEINLVNQGLLGTSEAVTDVPILSVNTADDDIAPPEDLALVTAASTNGKQLFIGEEGHCPPDQSDAVTITDWVIDHLNRA